MGDVTVSFSFMKTGECNREKEREVKYEWDGVYRVKEQQVQLPSYV